MAGNSVIGALRVVLGADTAALDKGLKDAQGALQRFSAQVKNAGLVAAGALAGAIGGTAVAMKGMIDQADKMGKLAQSVGVPVDELSRLNHAADLSGVSVESLAKAMGRLSKSMMEVGGGAENNVSQTLNTLGIAVKNADGSLKSSSQVMAEVAGKFAAMQDGAGKTAIAMNLFGRAGAELIPMLNAGKTGLQEMMAEADALGIVIDSRTAKAAEAFNDNLTRLSRVKDGFVLKVTQELLPAMQLLSQRFVEAAKDGTTFQTAAQSVANMIKFVASEVASAVVFVQRLGAELSALWNVITSIGSSNFSSAWQQFKEAGAETERQFARLKETVAEFWNVAAANADAQAQETGNKLAAPIVAASEVVKKLASEGEAAWKRIEAAGKRMTEQTRTPLEEFRQKIADINMLFWQGQISADTYARAVAQAQDKLVQANPAAQALESALTSAFDRALEGGQKFSEIVSQLIRDLAKMAAQAAFKQLMFGNVAGGGTSLGLLGSIFSGLPGFAQGGSFKVPGAGGIDSQIAAMRVTPGERVTVTKDGSYPGGGAISIVNHNDFRGVDPSQRAFIAAQIRQSEARMMQSIPAEVGKQNRNRPGYLSK